MSSAPPEAAIRHVDRALGVLHWHNLRVFLIAGALGPQHMAVFEHGARELLGRYRGGIVSLTLIDADGMVTSRGMRERLIKMRGELGDGIRHSAIVIEGSGVWARTARTLLRGLEMIAPPAQRSSMHGAVEPALALLLPLVQTTEGRPPQGAELLGHIAALRRRVTPGSAAFSASAT